MSRTLTKPTNVLCITLTITIASLCLTVGCPSNSEKSSKVTISMSPQPQKPRMKPKTIQRPEKVERWNGTWETTYYQMEIVKSDGQVTGTYGYRGGRFEGREVAPGVVQGRWAESDASNDEYRGDFEWRFSADGNRFTGKWCKGYGNTMNREWNGQKKTE